MSKSRAVELTCRVLIGLVFIWASIHKITNPCQLATDIYHYQMVPGALINLLAMTLPFTELTLGFCLILGIAPRGAALGIILTLIFFIIILGINLIRGIEFTCGCFGSAKDDWCEMFMNWYKNASPDLSKTGLLRLRVGCDILRDIIFLIPAVVAFVLLRKRLDRPKYRYNL